MQGLQIRLNPTAEQERWLVELAEAFNTCCRTGYQRLVTGALTPEDLTPWLSEQGLTSRQVKSAVTQIEMWRATGRGTRTHQIARLTATVDGLEHHLNQLKAEQEMWAERAGDLTQPTEQRAVAAAEVARLNALRFQKRRRQDRLARELAAVVQQSETHGKPQIFGGKKRLDQRTRIGECTSPWATPEDWRVEWQRIRNRSFTWVGASRETGGNPIAQINPVVHTLTLRLTEGQAMERLQQEAERLGKSIERVPGKLRFKRLVLTGLTFGPKEGRKLAQAQALGLPITVTVSQKLTASGKRRRAQRLPLRAKDLAWYAHAAFDLPAAPVQHTRQRGVLGVDFNAWGVAWCICTHEGNVMKGAVKDAQGHRRTRVLKGNLPLKTGLSSAQNEAQIHEAVRTLTALAETYGVAIAQEALDFFVKRWRAREQGPRYARMIHALKTAGFQAALQARCRKRGIAWHQVNPAWTSFAGFVKYGVQNRLSVDQAAAFLIARRATLAKHWVARPLATHRSDNGKPLSPSFQRTLKNAQAERLANQKLWHHESVRLAQPIPLSFQRKVQGPIDCSTWPALRKVLGSERHLWVARLYGEAPLVHGDSKARQASGNRQGALMTPAQAPPPSTGKAAGMRPRHGDRLGVPCGGAMPRHPPQVY